MKGLLDMRRSALFLAVTAAASVAAVSGCGSSSSGGSSAAAAAVPTPPICTQIGDALGNGPDPDADPVGYAEAQIGPLAGIHPSSAKLATAVSALDAAFTSEYAAKASAASKTAVVAAQKDVNAICPGAAS